jgi:hypothetical protein
MQSRSERCPTLPALSPSNMRTVDEARRALGKVLLLGRSFHDPRSGLAEVLAGRPLFPSLCWTASYLLVQLIGLPLCPVGFGALLRHADSFPQDRGLGYPVRISNTTTTHRGSFAFRCKALHSACLCEHSVIPVFTQEDPRTPRKCVIVPTIRSQVLYVFLVLAHARRRSRSSLQRDGPPHPQVDGTATAGSLSL